MAARRLIGALALGLVTQASAQVIPPPAYQMIAAQAGIPSSVLFAIALQESGTRLRGQTIPWPWTLNVAGNTQHFANRQQACTALMLELTRQDPRRIDVGLGQTNLGYHPERYASACEALDPRTNLAVTAALLKEHFEAAGDWVQAAGRYHRPAGGEPAARYRAQFIRHWQRIDASAALNLETQP